MKKIIENFKYIKITDFLKCILFVLILIPAYIYRIYLKIINKKIYLICELQDEACDNGYHLFKYIRENYPQYNFYYAINKKSKDFKKIKKYGNIIQFGSLKHWIYYLSATKNISTHKSGNPCPPLFYVLHVYLNLFNNRVFLQHGITMNNSEWLYYKNTKFSAIICAAKKEYEFIKENFGYPEKNVLYLGFPRYDNLTKTKADNKKILLMPTWRNWLGRSTNFLENKKDFELSKYYKKYNSLINNKKLIELLEKNNITLYFYPHRNMQKFIKEFVISSKNIKIVEKKDIDIQELLINSSLMITDYSSVSLDFTYMKKPLIYYQFDSLEYREKQLQLGYFSYEDDGFGDVLEQEKQVINKVIYYVENDFKLEEKYKKRSENFFELRDKKNCERVFKYLTKEEEI